MRLDAFLAQALQLTRKEAKQTLKTSGVFVNGERIKKAQHTVDPHQDTIVCEGQTLLYEETTDYLYHKPKGVVVAHRDAWHPTIFEQLPLSVNLRDLKALGRLDKDTTGLMILSTDGRFNHQLMHGKKALGKTYDVTLDRVFESQQALTQPMRLRDGQGRTYQVKTPTVHGVHGAHVRLTIYEGKTHQVKHMFASLGYEVIALHRHAIGSLTLPPNLKAGDVMSLDKALKSKLLEEANQEVL